MTAEDLLQKAATQFRFYESQHRRKVDGWGAELVSEGRPFQRQDLEIKIADTIEKADVNAALAQEIEDFLDAA